MAPLVEAYQAMRGASFLVAVTFAAEIGDVRRFDTPRQLMSFLGLVPAESSTGETVRRKGLTLAGNRRARRVLVEAAWTYRYPARVGETLRARLEGLPKRCGRYCPGRHQIRVVRPISPTERRRQEAAGRSGGNRSRDSRLPRAIGREVAAWISGRPHTAAAQRRGGSHGGELPSLVMWPGCGSTPVL